MERPTTNPLFCHILHFCSQYTYLIFHTATDKQLKNSTSRSNFRRKMNFPCWSAVVVQDTCISYRCTTPIRYDFIATETVQNTMMQIYNLLSVQIHFTDKHCLYVA